MFIKAKKADAIQTGQEDAQIVSLHQYTEYHRTIEEGWRTGTYSSDNSLVEDGRQELPLCDSICLRLESHSSMCTPERREN